MSIRPRLIGGKGSCESIAVCDDIDPYAEHALMNDYVAVSSRCCWAWIPYEPTALQTAVGEKDESLTRWLGLVDVPSGIRAHWLGQEKRYARSARPGLSSTLRRRGP